MRTLISWVKKRYRRIVNSIAFYPALIGLLFLFLSYLLITLDFSETGKHIKLQLHWLRLKDATTARCVIRLSNPCMSFPFCWIIVPRIAPPFRGQMIKERCAYKACSQRLKKSLHNTYYRCGIIEKTTVWYFSICARCYRASWIKGW